MRKTFVIFSLILIIPFILNADGGFYGDKVRAATNNTWVTSTSPPTVYAGDWFEGEIWLWYQNDPGLGAQFRYTTDNWSTVLYDAFSRGQVSGNDARYSNQGSSIGPWTSGTTVKYQIQCFYDWETDLYTSVANFTVSALNDPSSLSITNNETNPNTQLDISWNQNGQSHSVLIVRRTGQAVSWAPSQGTNYNDWDDLGDDTVVIRSSEGSTSIIDNNNGSGLEPNTTYHYKLYSENNQYYSSGITGEDQPLPVTLSSFSTAYIGGAPKIYWRTETESNNDYWNVFRSISQNLGQASWLNVDVVIEGAGTTSEPTEYEYEDLYGVEENTTYFYWIECVDYAGEADLYGPAPLFIPEGVENNGTPTAPDDYGLKQNYPNPFNPDTEINFALAENSPVRLTIYNIKGEKIKTIFEGFAEADMVQSAYWDGTDANGKNVATGVYYYKLITDTNEYQKKMLMVK